MERKIRSKQRKKEKFSYKNWLRLAQNQSEGFERLVFAREQPIMNYLIVIAYIFLLLFCKQHCECVYVYVHRTTLLYGLSQIKPTKYTKLFVRWFFYDAARFDARQTENTHSFYYIQYMEYRWYASRMRQLRLAASAESKYRLDLKNNYNVVTIRLLSFFGWFVSSSTLPCTLC